MREKWVIRPTRPLKIDEIIAIAYLDSDFLTSNFPRFRDSATSRYLRDGIIGRSDIENTIPGSTYSDSAGRGCFNDDPQPKKPSIRVTAHAGPA